MGNGASENEDDPGAYQLDREPEPSDSLRTFGAFVQAMREHAGYSRTEFGALVGYSKYTVESVEYGRRMPDRSFVEGADSATGNTGALKKAAKHLTRSDVGFAAWFRQWARLERIAVSLLTYECRVVPGLLQTEAYARAVFEGAVPVAPDDQMESFMAQRMERQRMLLERPTTPFDFIIEEHVPAAVRDHGADAGAVRPSAGADGIA